MSPWRIHVFGVRHLSPSGAWHLRRFLDQVRPKIVLIEGLDDAASLIPDITRAGTKPPIAILAYTDSQPVRTLVYPVARYSPEYQALKWADEHDAQAEFIDLPADIFLGLQDIEAERLERQRKNLRRIPKQDRKRNSHKKLPRLRICGGPSAAHRSTSGLPLVAASPITTPTGSAASNTISKTTATAWPRSSLARLFATRTTHPCGGLRTSSARVICAAVSKKSSRVGSSPSGSSRWSELFMPPYSRVRLPAMTDDELARLRRRSSKLTLMPYSYFKLSTQSGYGAGNPAPKYFELLWESLQRQELGELPGEYLAHVARHLRTHGTHRSICGGDRGVRLARTLAALREGSAPTLRDLRDSAVTLIGHGEGLVVRDALAEIDIGSAIGELPKGVSQTSIQTDFDRELARLKLEKYRTSQPQDIKLDLRENRHVTSEQAAFLDLHRSSFFHRLRMLGITFAKPVSTGQQSTTWAEQWKLQWSPESEIALVEAVLLGETVELATGFQFKTQLEACTSIARAADLVTNACQCGLMASMDLARQRLQELAVVSSELNAVAHAAFQLSQVVRYGDVRKFDPKPLFPLLEELFVSGALALQAAANCDNDAAKAIVVSMEELNRVSLEHSDRVDEALWIERLRKLSDADDRNPLLSGFACATLLERNLIDNDALVREVSRRLSPGVPADLGAGWFEGLAKRNRHSLLARQALWEALASYIESLDADQFKRALVFLRRAFGFLAPERSGRFAKTSPISGAWMKKQPLTKWSSHSARKKRRR